MTRAPASIRPLRIAYARIMQESNALSPVATTLYDFESCHYLEGDALAEATSPRSEELPGFFKNAELSGFVRATAKTDGLVTPVPILSAWASSNGPLSLECFEELERRLIAGLSEAGPVDGVFLALHGAMGVSGVRDPESRLLRSAKLAAGGVPVVTTHDLHGNLTKERVELSAAIVAYRTNPHRDHAKVGARAAELLFGIVWGTITPTIAWRSLPMILGGGKTLDFLAPVRPIFRRMRKLEKSGRVLTASTFMAHPWNDDPRLGWSTFVMTNNDQAGAEAIADELAERCWAVRHEQPPTFKSADEAIAIARKAKWARRLGAVTMSDASDVVTAGAPGDSTHLLRALVDQAQGLKCYASVRDPQAVARMWELETGAELTTAIGGNLDPSSSEPLHVRCTLEAKHHLPGFERMLVLAVGTIRIVVVEGPALVMKPSFYRNVGLNPWKADVMVVKNFFPFLLFFLPMNRRTVFVKTRGVTDFDAACRIDFDGPVHPCQSMVDWHARDAERRGIVAN